MTGSPLPWLSGTGTARYPTCSAAKCTLYIKVNGTFAMKKLDVEKYAGNCYFNRGQSKTTPYRKQRLLESFVCVGNGFLCGDFSENWAKLALTSPTGNMFVLLNIETHLLLFLDLMWTITTFPTVQVLSIKVLGQLDINHVNIASRFPAINLRWIIKPFKATVLPI